MPHRGADWKGLHIGYPGMNLDGLLFRVGSSSAFDGKG